MASLDIDREESDSDSNGEEEKDSCIKELNDVTLGELQDIRQKVGSKKFDSMLKKSREDKEKRSFKRANKNRPRELSSKKPVSRFREVVAIESHKNGCDPRFDERSGTFNGDLFQKSFSFVQEMKQQEKQLLQKELKKTRSHKKKKELEDLLQKIKSKEKETAKEEERRSLVREHKKTERELLKKGKKPFHIKKSTLKKIELAKKYSELKQSGKLEKFVERKRKKNAKRDRKQLPYTRQQ